MCSPATCSTCGKATYSGCGRHVDQVLAGVPKSRRCSCGEARTASRTTAAAAAGAPAADASPRRRWFRR